MNRVVLVLKWFGIIIINDNDIWYDSAEVLQLHRCEQPLQYAEHVHRWTARLHQCWDRVFWQLELCHSIGSGNASIGSSVYWMEIWSWRVKTSQFEVSLTFIRHIGFNLYLCLDCSICESSVHSRCTYRSKSKFSRSRIPCLVQWSVRECFILFP